MTAKNLLREVVRAVRAFDARELWQRFENVDCFTIHVDGLEHPLVASVMGAGAEQFGLMLLRGPHAAACFAALVEPDGPSDDVVETMDTLGFSIDEFGDLDEDLQRFYRRAGLRPRVGDEVPFLVSKPPNRRAHPPDDDELRLLLMVVKGLVAADRQGLLEPTELDDPAGVCTLTLTGAAAEPEVTVAREALPVVPLPPARPVVRLPPRETRAPDYLLPQEYVTVPREGVMPRVRTVRRDPAYRRTERIIREGYIGDDHISATASGIRPRLP